jgi:hypothetical protein
VNPNIFNEGLWDTHVHWTKTGRKRGWWQCRLVRSHADGRYVGVAHRSFARGYAQVTWGHGWRYRFVLNAGQAAERHWGNLVRPWQYLSTVDAPPYDESMKPLGVLGQMFTAFLAAEQLCGRWSGNPNTEWDRPHVLQPCQDCPAPIIFRLKKRGVQGLRWPEQPTKWPQQERVVSHPGARKRAKPQRCWVNG